MPAGMELNWRAAVIVLVILPTPGLASGPEPLLKAQAHQSSTHQLTHYNTDQ